jgi:hypothetical protein
MSGFPKKPDVHLSNTYLKNRIFCNHFLEKIKPSGKRFLTNGNNLPLTENIEASLGSTPDRILLNSTPTLLLLENSKN